MSGLFEGANELAILSVGRNPSWVTQAAFTGRPASASAGAHTQEAVRTLIEVNLREDPHHRTARVTVTTLDLTATYTVTVDGVACAYNAGGAGAADLGDVLDGIAAAINAAAVSDIVEAEVDDETVVVTGLGGDHWSVAIAATGTGVLACETDYALGRAQVWLLPAGASPSTTWRAPRDGLMDVETTGLSERLDTAGFDRVYVELLDLAGLGDGATVTFADPVVRLGPCINET